MRPRLLLLALTGLLGACAAEELTDADWDGIPASRDCDDGDPEVYPGAPDAPGDGVDADCDGIDPDHAYVGEWSVVELTADFSSLTVIMPGLSTGTLDLEEEAADLEVNVTIDPELVGYELALDLVFTGSASPVVDAEDAVRIYLEGNVGSEQSTMELDCAVIHDEGEEAHGFLACDGTLKALDANLLTAALFAPA